MRQKVVENVTLSSNLMSSVYIPEMLSHPTKILAIVTEHISNSARGEGGHISEGM